MRDRNYKHTMYASYFGCITQAITNNLTPLLLVTFQREFNISLEQISLLITLNFSIQMIVDFLAANYVEKIGYRVSIVGAHIFSTVGLIGLGIFPYIFTNQYLALVLAVVIYAIGGGLIEVLISPIVEALPNDAKSAAMSLSHSFYCWGHVGVVVLSTLYFNIIGIENWRYLPMIWALVPMINAISFTRVPINTYGEEETKLSLKSLFGLKIFWLFFILMVCSGASEQAMSQWASIFAETGLKVSKTMGDLLGPCMFAILMGLSRLFYGKFGEKINLKKFISLSSILCVVSYLIASLSPIPFISLIGCGLCGLSVGIMWPGVFSLSAKHCPQGGTAMFALLALAGDIGCFSGPSVVGVISGIVENNNSADIGLKIGLLFAIIFPILLLICVGILKKTRQPMKKVNL